MDNLLSRYSEDLDPRSSAFLWWRSAEEFDSHGRLKIDLSNLSELGPRLKILREMERLAVLAPEALDDLRHKLLGYRSGDFWIPTGGINKDEMDIPPLITVLLLGFAGAGKSSLINLMYSVLGRAGLIPFAQTAGKSSEYQTMFMEEHNVLRSMRNGFCVYDSRGFEYNNVEEGLESLSEWMVDGIHHHQLCWREGGEVSEQVMLPSTEVSSKFAKRRVNCAIVVADMFEIYRSFKAGGSRQLEATKQLFRSPAIRQCNENPIVILTHGDLLSTQERLEARAKICEFIGVSETTGAYDIACLTEHGFLTEEADPVTAYTLTEAVYRALLFSDRGHSPRRNLKDRVLNWLARVLCCIAVYFAAFFALLACWFSKLGKTKLKQ